MRIATLLYLLIFSIGVFGQTYKIKKSTVSAGGGAYSGGAFKTTVSVGDPGTAISLSTINTFSYGYNLVFQTT